jgi:choline dehydrogenase-like flavoprotein
MDTDFFVDEKAWQRVVSSSWDHIVVGSGFTALAFTQAALERQPDARILLLERGPFWLTQHFQDTPLPFKFVLGGRSETFPWTLSAKTVDSPVGYMHGSCPFFGGRSTFWSAWSPTPTPALMRDWPQGLVQPTQEPGFWERACELLNVITADVIGDPVYDELQTQLSSRLDSGFKQKIPSATEVYDAPMAVGNPKSIDVRFEKFSVPGQLLALKERRDQAETGALTIATRCAVERLLNDGNGQVTALATSRGELPVGDANVIIATGAVPPASLLLNSFPGQEAAQQAGEKLTAHFLTHVAARIPRSAFGALPDHLQIAAMYLAGLNPSDRQYHVQITAIAAPDPENDAVDAGRECPDYAAAATPEQLADSADHVVFVCATLGELAEDNPENWVRLNAETDPTTNITLQVVPNSEDMELWDLMDEATLQTIGLMAGPQPGALEYWHDDPTGPPGAGSWSATPPSPAERRIPGLVHEAGPVWMGEPGESVTGPDFRPHGIENVYLTGAGLFPTSGSWNPTLTMCGLAQHLADTLAPDRVKEHA